jgi:energy-coupling factor transport system ATP-binding protein
VAYAVVLVAIGVALAPYTSFPIGIAKVNPTQHFVNVLGAVLLGPWWAMTIAGVIGVIRNVMGIGTLLAFPGGIYTMVPSVKSSVQVLSHLLSVPSL